MDERYDACTYRLFPLDRGVSNVRNIFHGSTVGYLSGVSKVADTFSPNGIRMCWHRELILSKDTMHVGQCAQG